ncbi:hypothetical protein CMALT430_110023 [Carnobacterium maltaromaticum]|nr:hypothetical protein CMALT430_110023 [Carnobacterium maltaromaticum]
MWSVFNQKLKLESLSLANLNSILEGHVQSMSLFSYSVYYKKTISSSTSA